MDGNQELPPTGEGQTQKHTLPAEEPRPKKTGLAAKLINVRSDSQARVNGIELLVESAMATGEAAIGPITLDTLSLQAEELTQGEIDPSEYLVKSRQLLGSTAQLIDQTQAEIGTAWREHHMCQLQIRKIDYRLKELESVTGLKRYTTVLERRTLISQRAQFEEQVAAFQAQAEAKRELVTQAREREKVIRQKHEDVLIAKAAEAVEAIKKDYEEFLAEIYSDGAVIDEIQEACIQRLISPESDKIPPERKAQFRAALRNYLRHRHSSEQEKQQAKQELDSFATQEGLLNRRHAYVPLSIELDELIIQRLVAKIAASDISAIKAVIEPQLDVDSKPRFKGMIKDAISDEDIEVVFRNNTSFAGRIFSEMAQSGKDSYPNMIGWEALKSSDSANEIFGNFIQEEDDKIFAVALEKSLIDIDGNHIDVLGHFTRPEAIRNLVILAAADSRNYRTAHANSALINLAQRDDWGEILDQAELAYPALRSARPALENWTYGEQTNAPGFQEVTNEFALSIIEGDQVPEILKDLAIEALPNHALLDILNKRGIISEIEAATLAKAEAFLGRISEESWRKNMDSDNTEIIPYIDKHALKVALRNNLFKLIYADQQDKTHSSSMRRLVALSQRILDNESNYELLKYLTSVEVIEVIAKNQIQPELIFAFPDQARPLMDEKMSETRAFIFKNGEIMLRDHTDLKFLSSVVSEFGQKSDYLIRGYHQCLEAGVITHAEKELVLEFARQFRVISPTTLGGYKEAKEAGHERVYIAQLTALAEKMTGQGTITDTERNKPFYKDLLRHVYANNSGQYTTHEENETCDDRASDIAGFKIESRYEIDLLSQSEIRVKAGENLRPEIQAEVQAPILAISERMGQSGYDYEKIKGDLNEEINTRFIQIIEKGGLPGVSVEGVSTPEERLFLILTDSIYGSQALDSQVVKNLLIAYEFAYFEDISDYIAGTRDRVTRASNQDYALLCEVGAFYSDRIKEVNRRLVEAAWSNPTIVALMPEYFKRLAQENVASGRQDKINRLQPQNLGLTDGFVRQIVKVLEKRRGRKYEPDEIRSIISHYEGITGGLTERASISTDPQTRAFYGQLRSQRERTIEAVKLITGDELDTTRVHLGEINIDQVLEVETSIREGKYDEEQFASYTVQRFIDLFEEERGKIESELDKFESLSGKQKEVLHAYVTKSKESAHARMVGGVCVAGDNPGKYPDKNMWNMPNFFQLVLQEPDTLQCQGVVMLHNFVQGDKKVLVASINPTSTYLYSVDEAALFKGIMGTLEQFATNNGFDMISFSQNKAIRTNRTGGQFERMMEERVTEIGKTFTFDSPQQFSYHPKYDLQAMDVVWERAIAA